MQILDIALRARNSLTQKPVLILTGFLITAFLTVVGLAADIPDAWTNSTRFLAIIASKTITVFAMASFILIGLAAYTYLRSRAINDDRRCFRQVTELGAGFKAIFVYGSLLSPKSIARTLGTARDTQVIRAELNGFGQAWIQTGPRTDLVVANEHGTHFANYSYLQIVASPGSRTPGAVIGVTDEEYRSLCARESHYKLIDITEDLRALDDKCRLPNKVETFIIPNQGGTDPNIQHTIRRNYLKMVQNAQKALKLNPVSEPPASHQLVDSVFPSERLDQAVAKKTVVSDAARASKAIQQARRTDQQSDLSPSRELSYTAMPVVISAANAQSITAQGEILLRFLRQALIWVAGQPKLLQFLSGDATLAEYVKEWQRTGGTLPTLSRIDATLVGQSWKILELNSDSPAGLFDLSRITRLQELHLGANPDLSWITWPDSCSFQRYIDQLKLTLASGRGRVIVLERDPESWGSLPEMKAIVNAIQDGEISASILNSDDLTSDTLAGKGELLVVKRIVWNDLRSNPELANSLKARTGLHVENHPGSAFLGNKLLLSLIWAESSPAIAEAAGLGPADLERLRDAVPLTFYFGEDAPPELLPENHREFLSRVKRNPEKWVLKDGNGFGGSDVHIGYELERPARFFAGLYQRGGYVAQIVAPHGRELVYSHSSKSGWIDLTGQYTRTIYGAYFMRDRFLALEAKSGETLPINVTNGAVRSPVCTVSGDNVLAKS